MALPRSLEVLHERSFARYLASVTVSTLGSGMAIVALAFAVLDFGGATDLGIVLLAREIPMVIFLLLGGVFADRLPRRVILIGCDLVKGSAQVVTAVLLFAGTANVWNVGLLQAVFGIAAAFSRPATTGIVREAVSEERLQEGNALLGLSRNILSIAAPAIGALIVALGTPALAIANRCRHLLRRRPRSSPRCTSRPRFGWRRSRSSETSATAGASSSSARGLS